MKAEFSVDITVKDLYKFSLNNMYRKVSGVIWILFSIAVVVVAIYTWGDVSLTNSILLILLAALYTVINPVILFFRAKSQVKKNPSFMDTLNYVIDENGITVMQGEDKASVKWIEMWKAVKYGSIVVVYVSNIRAFIFPVRCIGEQYNTLVELAKSGLGARNYLKKDRN